MSLADPQLCVGPLRFLFAGESGRQVCYGDWAYRGFFSAVGQDVSLASPVTLTILLAGGMPDMPERAPDFLSGRNWAAWNRSGGMRFCSGFAGRERPRFACDLASSLDECILHVDGSLADAPLRYPLDQILTWGLLGTCGGVLLHAAAVEHDGVGYVLAGRSGAGKSTLSGFCHASGWDILNDDRVIVHPDPVSGQWLVSGTPWHGTGCFARNRTVPLGGVYLLQQDRENVAEEIALQAARYALMDVAGIAWFQEVWSQQALDAIARLTEEVPVWRLRFTRSADAVEMLGK